MKKNKPEFSELRKRARLHSEHQYDPVTQKWIFSEQRASSLSEDLISKAMVDCFLCCGLDYKGQSQYCYVDRGKELGFDVSFDPARLATGVFATEITAKGSLAGSKQAFIIAQRGPKHLDTIDIPHPIFVHCLSGIKWSGAAGIEIFSGVKVDAGIKFTPDESVVGSKDEIEDEQPPEFLSEGIGLAFEAKAGFQADAKGQFDNFYAEDLSPIPFSADEKSGARELLTNIFKEGSYKAVVKKKAIAFIKSKVNDDLFEPMDYEIKRFGFFDGHTSSADIIENLLKGAIKQKCDAATRNTAISYARSLRCWAEDDERPIVPTCIGIKGWGAQAGSGLVASVEGTVNSGGVASAQLAITLDAMTVNGECKSTSTRYQVVYPYAQGTALNHQPDSFLTMTQDAQIVYKQIAFTPAKLKAEVAAGVIPPGLDMKKAVVGAEKEVGFEERQILNQLSYVCTSVYWAYQKPEPPKGMAERRSSTRTTSVATLQGTGISFGQSFLIKNLLKFYEKPDGTIEMPASDDQVVVDPVTEDPIFAKVKSAIKKYKEQTSGIFKWRSDETLESIPALEKLLESKSADLRPAVEWLLRNSADKPASLALSSQLKSQSRFQGLLKTALDDAPKPEPKPKPVVNKPKQEKQLHTKSVLEYFEKVAESLRVDYQDINRFMNDEVVMLILIDLLEAEKIEAILLEASFSVPGLTTVEIDQQWTKSFKLESVALSKNASEKILEKATSAPQGRELESIAIRYRIQDSIDRSGNLFTLGFRGMGQGFNIKLVDVDRAGSSGIVDLHKVWFGAKLQNGLPENNYEFAVPQTVLLNQ